MSLIRRFKLPLFLAVIFLAMAIWWPDVAGRSSMVAVDYLQEMALIIPAVFVLMGLLEVWVPKERITQLIGAGSGLKGIFFAFLMGTLPTGPLYIAFPMASALLQKGAGVSNMTVRFASTLAAVIMIGRLMDLAVRPEDLANLDPN